MLKLITNLKENILNINKDTNLLFEFNNKNALAYGAVYNYLYKELYYYAYSLYNESVILPEDIIQDVFLEVWENKKIKFDSLKKIKAYIYIVIKHKFLMHCRHQKFISKEITKLASDDVFFIAQAVEAEVFSYIPEALNLLPEQCAISFKLFLEGYDIKDIAAKLNKTESTIYKQREKSISILRKKMPKDKLLLLLLHMS